MVLNTGHALWVGRIREEVGARCMVQGAGFAVCGVCHVGVGLLESWLRDWDLGLIIYCGGDKKVRM